ncbi:MAG: FAD-binding oxidoreductase [Verrucomicrobia bacterium]|nr:FAD-binding oxidoreductase [Verrucomicrobiota bacterium]
MKNTADVVVIGAGVHGAATAFHLARAGAGRVVVVDKSGVASGPTARSGAMMRPIFTEAPYIQLVMEATQMMEHWDELVGGDAGFVERGFLRFTRTFEKAELGGDLKLMKELGVEFEILDADALRARVPDAEFRGDEQGLWLPRAGYADPVLTTRTLARAAVRHGVTVLEGVQVTAIDAPGSRIESVQTDQGPIHTRTVVNCAGPWSARLAAGIGVALPIETHCGGTSLFQRPEAIPAGGPILSDGVNQVYFREVGDSVLRASHFGWTHNPVDPDDYDETISARQLQTLRDDLRKRYRSMQRGVFAGGFSAIYDMTPDAHPIIGNIGGVGGFWCNCGWSGNGFASSAAVGRHLAARIAGQTSEVDLGMFAWPRPPGTKMRPDGNWVKR